MKERYELGENVTFWLTGEVARYKGVVTRLDEYGYPDRIRCTSSDSPVLQNLKPGDFILLDESGPEKAPR